MPRFALTSSFHHVACVVCVRSGDEVRGLHAGRGVASVPQQLPGRYGSDEKFIADTMSAVRALPVPEDSVATGCVSCSRPEPAALGRRYARQVMPERLRLGQSVHSVFARGGSMPVPTFVMGCAPAAAMGGPAASGYRANVHLGLSVRGVSC